MHLHSCENILSWMETSPGSRPVPTRALIQSGGKSRKVPEGDEAWSSNSEHDSRLAKYTRCGKGILCGRNSMRQSMVMRQLDQLHPMARVLRARGNKVWRGKSWMVGFAKDLGFHLDIEGI